MVRPVGTHDSSFNEPLQVGVQKGSGKSVKQQAKAFFSKLSGMISFPRPEAIGKIDRKVEKLDKEIQKLKAKQNDARPGSKTLLKVSEKLEKALAERSQLRPLPQQQDPFQQVRDRLKHLIQTGDQAKAWDVADKLGKGLLVAYGCRTAEQVPAFLQDQALQKLIEKKVTKEDLSYMFMHIRNTYPQHEGLLNATEGMIDLYQEALWKKQK